MRWKSAVLVTALLVLGAAPSMALAKRAPAPSYYLSLGDSLAQGVQPNASGASVETNQGYADVLYAAEKTSNRHLKLAKYGCPGESTTSMIKGGPFCKARPYTGTQLAAAVKFIHKHKVVLITLDIGANDVDGCVTNGALNATCLTNGLNAIKLNVPKIVAALRHAAGPKVKIAGMTYYDPFLSLYFGTPAQRALASASVGLAQGLNTTLATDFRAKNVRVADVATAFNTYTPFTKTTTLAGHGTVPVAVAQICRLTWICTPAPRGPNIHAKAGGYKKIAATFLAKL
jgi:lysophospholipase L1-like esterase